MEKNLLKFDEWNSTYGWRCLIKAEFDYRKVAKDKFIIKGFSGYQGVPEMKNKDQLLLLNVASLFEKRWVYKSSGILIYKATSDRLLRNFDKADVIIEIKKDGDCVDLFTYNGWENDFVEENLLKMAKHYNNGYQRTLPLRIVK